MNKKIAIAAFSSVLFVACSEDTPTSNNITSSSSSALSTSSGTNLSSNGSSSNNVVSSSSQISSSNSSSSTNSSSSSGGTVLFNAANTDNWGVFGSGVIAPDADYSSGGSSKVTAPDGTYLGGCATGSTTCTANWDLTSSLTAGVLDADLTITAWVPSSASTNPWASAGWDFIPVTSGKPTGSQTWFDVAKPMGLTASSTLSIDLSYTAGSSLILELDDSAVTAATANGLSAPPRYTITGTGARQTVTIPISAIKPASWSSITSYDPTLYSSIRLMRLITGTAGQVFPAAEASKVTEIKVYSISFK